jgi:hypothetical protein
MIGQHTIGTTLYHLNPGRKGETGSEPDGDGDLGLFEVPGYMRACRITAFLGGISSVHGIPSTYKHCFTSA